MVAVRLTGGLGNQMFQYATAYAIARELNTTLKLDTNGFSKKISDENFTQRNFELDIFNLEFDKVNPVIWKIYRKLSSMLCAFDKFIPGFLVKVYSEKSLSFDETLFSINGNAYLCGYFQSEKYFQEYRKDLLRLFRFKFSITGRNREVVELIKRNISVSVHIRRGDYVSNKQINSIHGIIGLKYYLKAIDFLFEKLNNPVFFFFSDDIEWVKENFQLDSQILVYHNTGSQSYIDMQLMTYCNHNIIANSSFSWWGAWLNQNPGKIVIAPEKWFEDPILNLASSDIIPNRWIRLDES
jgi:hypothetical protein